MKRKPPNSNNFGASFGGPLLGKKKQTFFFRNYEGFRLAQADAQVLTVPSPAKIAGDFGMSNVTICDPTTASSPAVLAASRRHDPTFI